MSAEPANSTEDRLADQVAGFFDDPLGYVEFAFPWGEPGQLEEETGPDKWQRGVLEQLRDGIITFQQAVRIAVASGHGIGKSALIAWIVLWFISTRPHPQIVVTANTKTQLITKTWRELAKWQGLAINGHWFQHTATKFFYRAHPETWFAACVPWSENNPDAFAGTHERHVLVIYDEASNIADVIWETTEGAMSQPGAFWISFGNPIRNTGAFHKCFHAWRNRWWTKQVDSRDAKMVDKAWAQELIDTYGEDSDFVRIRVKGQFPRAASNQFISLEDAEAARGRLYNPDIYKRAAKILSLDVARFGDDQSAMIKRQGLQAFGLKKWRELDTMTLSGLVAQEIDAWRPDAVFVDGVGIGAGVVDRLRQLGFQVIEVIAGAKAADSARYFNKRAEMWGNMRDWLVAGGGIPDDQGLIDDLVGVQYQIRSDATIQLERKEDMKKRGLASPDAGDALAMSFSEPVLASADRRQFKKADLIAETSYDPFA